MVLSSEIFAINEVFFVQWHWKTKGTSLSKYYLTNTQRGVNYIQLSETIDEIRIKSLQFEHIDTRAKTI